MKCMAPRFSIALRWHTVKIRCFNVRIATPTNAYVRNWARFALIGDIARGAGAVVQILPSSVSQADGVDDYFVLFEQIYGKLTRALTTVKALP